jgi:Spy/CpxP family protein refolding chaperone
MPAMAKPLLILLSVALNSAFVVTWLTHVLPERKCQGKKETECALFEKIGVTVEQIKEIKPRLEQFCASAKAQCQEINRLRHELIDLISEAQPDRAAITAKQNEILEHQRKMEELVVEQLLTAKSVLTAKQQEAFFDLLRERCGCGGPEKELGLLNHVPENRSERPHEAANDCGWTSVPGSSS